MTAEDNTARPRKKQRLGGVPSPAAAATASTRAKFAFGSRLPDPGRSLIKGPKSSVKAKFQHVTPRVRQEQDARASTNPRKRRRSVSRDSDEAAPRTKPSHRPLTVKTTLPLQGSHLPPPTKVSNSLSGSRLLTISPSNPAVGNKKRSAAEAEAVAVAGLVAATDPAFWIKRREAVEAALKELDALEKRI
ncbi:hypothetical protein PR003_g10324 [Phytophthora rubi]|uniref:Uncharacterized protein n=1 Tax=Phytophthora rubi TaxID=129364 RepID=A0A6A3ML23_9STRA|nr:hypothetical protein PR002_g10145 [Phytophthora rubi]KAE9033901.1 hypothetical protein PR001_g9949 [Phytophthora rubi]KAE9340769.1 hypothetical protein PR003_g10324 [Phytophthora rubi]